MQFGSQKAGVCPCSAIIAREESPQPKTKAAALTLADFAFRFNFLNHAETSPKPVGAIPLDCHRPDRAIEFPVLNELVHMTSDANAIAVQQLPTALLEGERMILVHLLESGSPMLAWVSEEPLIGFVQPLDHILSRLSI